MSQKLEHIKKLTLERVKVALRQRVGTDFIDSIQIKDAVDIISNEIIFAITAREFSREVFHEEDVEKENVGVPINWFEHLKETIYNSHYKLFRWFRNKFPIKYKYIKTQHTSITNHYHNCPHLNIDTRNERDNRDRHFNFLANEKVFTVDVAHDCLDHLIKMIDEFGKGTHGTDSIVIGTFRQFVLNQIEVMKKKTG